MNMSDIPFGTTDWSSIEPTLHKVDRGVATWQAWAFGDIRVRLVEYEAHRSRTDKGARLFIVD